MARKVRRDEAYYKRRDAYLRRTYGITLAQYDAILLAQGGHCFFCNANGTTRALAVDHDHVTGEIRGLLCKRCNFKGLGWVEQVGLTSIRKYLRNPPARRVLTQPVKRHVS